MKHHDYIEDNQAFLFGFGDVLYPEKDYQLQVYYLFAQFIEYTEQIAGQEMISFMEETYLKNGDVAIYEQTAQRFGLEDKYSVNFNLLQQNARLPLKLLLFAPVLSFLQEINATGKPIFLLADGNPAQQLNKIRQMEWNGLEKSLKVYFIAETATNSVAEVLKIIMLEHGLKQEEILLVGQNKSEMNIPDFGEINFLPIDKLLVS